jgi:O-succinylbenzoate synthase
VEPLPPLDDLPAVPIERVELVVAELPVVAPLVTAHGAAEPTRPVLFVHVVGDGAEGWAECALEPAPTYDDEHTASAFAALRDELAPGALAAAVADWRELGTGPGQRSARAALELAELDAQLRVAGRPLAAWLGATERRVPAGATLGLHDSIDGLLAEADEALAAGARRLRVKIRPGSVPAIAALVAHVDGRVPVQADANGSLAEDDAELPALDELGLACLEQPLPADDLAGSARLVASLRTPVCLDEPVTSLAAVERAAELDAASVICLKPGRVGGWPVAREAQHRARELGLGVWLGGMLETAVGRAATAAIAALPGMTAAPDLDPRPRYAVELAEPLPLEDGWVTVPSTPGTGAVPDPDALASVTTTIETLRP